MYSSSPRKKANFKSTIFISPLLDSETIKQCFKVFATRNYHFVCFNCPTSNFERTCNISVFAVQEHLKVITRLQPIISPRLVNHYRCVIDPDWKNERSIWFQELAQVLYFHEAFVEKTRVW